jgi:hypothetical protein
VSRDGRGLRDPAGIAGVISATSTASSRERLVEAAVTARDRAARALQAEARRAFEEANRQWGMIFNLAL